MVRHSNKGGGGHGVEPHEAAHVRVCGEAAEECQRDHRVHEGGDHGNGVIHSEHGGVRASGIDRGGGGANMEVEPRG
jgi:hypothetical protein